MLSEEEIIEILCRQLQLLAKESKSCGATNSLCEITQTMVMLSNVIIDLKED